MQFSGALILAGILGLSGCMHSRDPLRSTGRVIDDGILASNVTRALELSAVYKFPYVRVQTYNGVVQLSGFVNKLEQRAEAAELARHIPNVVEVINNISLAPLPASDPMVSHQVSETTTLPGPVLPPSTR